MSGSTLNGVRQRRERVRSQPAHKWGAAVAVDFPEDVKARIRQRLALPRVVTSFSTWDLTVGIAPSPQGKLLGITGEFPEWPTYVQDKIMTSLVRDCRCRPKHHVKIVASGCFQDVPWEPAYLRVVVQEFPDEVRH